MAKAASNPQWCDRNLIKLPFYYGLALSMEDMLAELKRLDVPEHQWPENITSDTHSNATCWRFTDRGGKELMLVGMLGLEGRDLIAVYGLLVHEAVHIWQAYCRFIGEDTPSAEFEAYGIQWLAQNLMHSFDTQTKARAAKTTKKAGTKRK